LLCCKVALLLRYKVACCVVRLRDCCVEGCVIVVLHISVCQGQKLVRLRHCCVARLRHCCVEGCVIVALQGCVIVVL
jgi:hypothetical protein